MDFETLKKEFDEMFAAVSDEALVAAFAEMGCEIEIIPRTPSQWVTSPLVDVSCGLTEDVFARGESLITTGGWGRFETVGKPAGRHWSDQTFVDDCDIQVADSNELALAA
ncbi:hypothetical protein OJ996_09045 [Luteolibacter sp. GHJ8]|uniref:Uncharacterized protein n=1 Tax=Luteolibacter rhizosphaerae TaxID=2989719 RepID=A0ABT3G2C8_9BACT|nr:hypothetical protein [Luteolibacter rhizosphaerae]MCW1913719.1 hypothetical protein [Luteolibacter rhizosphaerae]